MSRRLFTSESVTEGHPDKIADQISDAILDAILEADPEGRVACETLVTTGLALVAGEVTTRAYVDVPTVVRGVIESIGYTDSSYGISGETCGVLVSLGRQSPDIAQGVDIGGAGDQGIMFGYATDETPELMPAPIIYAHRLTRRLAALRREGQLPWLRPDGKSQVTVEYDGDRPVAIRAVVLSAQHSPDVPLPELREELAREIREKALHVGVGAASVREIDRLNIHRATHLAMRRALARLPVAPEHVVVDGLPVPELGAAQTAVVRGDGLVHSVACASIVAKVTRDRLMRRLARRYPAYGWEHNAGYATAEHREALERLGPTPHHRLTFGGVQLSLALG